MKSLVRATILMSLLVAQIAPLKARDTIPGSTSYFFKRKKKTETASNSDVQKPKTGLLQRLFNINKKTPEKAPAVTVTPPPSPTPAPAPSSPTKRALTKISQAQESTLSPEEQAALDRAVQNAPKALIVPDDDFDSKLAQQEEMPTDIPIAIPVFEVEAIVAEETLKEIEFEVEENDPALSHEAMAAIAGGILGTTFLLTQAAHKAIKILEARQKALAQSSKGMARAELSQLEAKIDHLKTQYSWMQNRLSDAGIKIRFSAAGDIAKIYFQKLRRNPLATLEAELAKNQNDLAFAMKAAQDARTELEYKITKSLSAQARSLVADVDTQLAENKAAELKAKKDEWSKTNNEYHSHANRASDMETLRTEVIPYLNGGKKPPSSTLERYLSTTNLSDFEKEAWVLLTEKEKVHTQAASKVSLNKAKLVALEAHNKLAEKLPRLSSERLSRELIQARALSTSLAKQELAAKDELEAAKRRVLSHKPSERLTRIENEAKVKADAARQQANLIQNEISDLYASTQNDLQQGRQANESSARQVAQDRTARIHSFIHAPEDYMTPEQQAREALIRSREAAAHALTNQRTLAAGARFDENSALEIQRHANNATIAQSALQNFIGSYDSSRLIETSPELAQATTIEGRVSLKEAVSFQASQASRERWNAMRVVVDEAIKEKSTSKIDAALKSDPMNALAIEDLLELKQRELSSKKVPGLVFKDFRQELAFLKTALEEVKMPSEKIMTSLKAEAESGPLWRGIPNFYGSDHLDDVASNITNAHPTNIDTLKKAWEAQDIKKIEDLIKENPNRVIEINTQLNKWATEARKNKTQISPVQEELLKKIRNQNSAYLKKLKTRLADTKLSSKIYAEIWLIESLQVALGIPPRSNPADFYKTENAHLRKATLDELMKQTENSPSLNKKALAFVDHALAYHSESAASDELLAKLSVLKKVRAVLDPQSKVHAMRVLRSDQQIKDNYDGRPTELQRELDVANRELADLERKKAEGILTEFQKASIDAQIAAQIESIRLLEKNLASYVQEEAKVYVAKPGTHEVRLSAKPDLKLEHSSPATLSGFFKCKLILGQ